MSKLLPSLFRNRPRTRIVVAGANFAGLNLALHLPRRYDVTVVDPSPHFEFLPNIHELVSGLKAPADLQVSRRSLLRRAGHAFIEARVTEIDIAGHEVVTDGGQRLAYDVLGVAVGGLGTTRGISGADEHVLPFRTVADCAAIGARLRAMAGETSSRRPRVVIVGGGLEGVEALGEILRRHQDRLHVTLVESRHKLLPQVSPGLDREILRRCEGLPVRVITGTRVRQVERARVTLSDGEALPASAVIWTGGLVPHPLLGRAGLSPPDRWAPVHPTLQSVVDEQVFVVGDAAELSTPLGKQAYHALDMGAHAARNIDRMLRGRVLAPLSPSDKPMLVSFGDLDTYMIGDDRALAGAALSAAKEAVYQLVMSRLDARGGVEGVLSLLRRSRKGLADLALANLGSAEALGRSLNLRVLR